MSEFINTADVIGDDEMCDQIIMRTVTEYKENRVTTVGAYAFYGCKVLTTLDLPNVTSVGGSAWANCPVLKNINVPLLDINGGQQFMNCTGFEKLCLPATTNAATNSFYGLTSLRILDLPICNSLLNSIGNTPKLVALILRKTDSITQLKGGGVGEPIANGTGYIYVPRALVDSYKAATNWSTYAAQIRAIEDYEIESLSLNVSELTFTTSDSKTLTVTTVPEGRPVTWSSSNPGVVKVENGVVTPLLDGTAIITATGALGESVSCMVTVNAGLELDSTISYEIGGISYQTGAEEDSANRFRTESIPYDPSINTFQANVVVDGNTSAKARVLLRSYKADGTFISTSFHDLISPAAVNNWASSGVEYTFNQSYDCAYVRAVFADATDTNVSTLTGTITVSGITYDLIKE